MRNHSVAFIAISLVVGCGGGEGPSSSTTTAPSADVARTAGGEAIKTADGNAVSKKAHGKWKSALDEFEANEKSGWTSAKCSSTSKAFERVSDAQGGGFAEALYMAGLSLSRCGDDGAYDHYEAALKVDSKFCKARVAMGLRDMENGRMTVWASTQSPFGLKRQVVKALDLSEDQVRVITPFVGGGFGGKGSSPQGVQAARLAKLSGRPVQVFWTREDEFFWDTYRPAAIVKIRSGITAEGKPTLWDYRVYYAGARGSEQPYEIPNHRTVAYSRGWTGPPGSHPFATGAWRAPAANTNAFAREQQIDIMAAGAGIDPLEFRLQHCNDKKYRGVLTAAAERFGWEPAPGPSGRGVGVAFGIDADTVVASMAEVEVDRASGRIKVKRIVCAQDMGLVVNPAGATIQMEGCITMGLGYALAEEQHFQGGKILDLNFDRYELPRFSWLPEIETVLIDSEDPAPHGGGEPAIILMGAVIANAVYDAIGARVFDLPMTPERVKAAIDKTG